jgi:hypothetical protein
MRVDTSCDVETYPDDPRPLIVEVKLDPFVFVTPVIEESNWRLEMYPAVPQPANELWRLEPIKLERPVAVEATWDVTPPIEETN